MQYDVYEDSYTGSPWLNCERLWNANCNQPHCEVCIWRDPFAVNVEMMHTEDIIALRFTLLF